MQLIRARDLLRERNKSDVSSHVNYQQTGHFKVCTQPLSPMEACKLYPTSGYASTHMTKYVSRCPNIMQLGCGLIAW